MSAGTCRLCGRPLGLRRERHHLVPRSRGGRETVDLHPICHRKIHTVLTEKEIAESYAAIEALRGHPEVARFVRWVARKDPDWHGRTAASRRLRERR